MNGEADLVEDIATALSDLKSKSTSEKKKPGGNGGASFEDKEESQQHQQPDEIEDEAPFRLVDPLTIYQPTSHDIIAMLDIYFPRPDTFSLSYWARILGISYTNQKFLQQDICLPERQVEINEAIYHIPNKGYLPPEEPLDVVDGFYKVLLENPDRKSNIPLHHATAYRLTLDPLVIDPILQQYAPDQTVKIGFESYDKRTLTLVSKDKSLQISYRFEWFLIDETSSELILSIEKIHRENAEIADHDTVLLINLAFEHARSCKIWYARFPATYPWLTSLFAAEIRSNVAIFDLHATNHRLSFLLMDCKQAPTSVRKSEGPVRHRYLARLPNMDETRYAIENRVPRSSTKKPSPWYSGSSNRSQVHVKAKLEEEKLTLTSTDGKVIDDVPTFYHEPKISFFRDFDITTFPEEEEDDLIVVAMKEKQALLREMEAKIQPKLTNLMDQIVQERFEYEKPENRQRRKIERHLVHQHLLAVERKKRIEEARLRRQAADDSGVCAICDDGESAPHNKIIYCDSCDVGVHQLCYGVENIPEGDYFCIPCRYLGRDSQQFDEDQILDENDENDFDMSLPISCELCPIRKGAYVRTNMPDQGENGKWVHAVCGKWQGLNFVEKNNPELLEDVTELKRHFLINRITCILCQGERGAMIQCRIEDCKNWVHVTCARFSRLCEVIHGDGLHGPVEENPWTLLCPAHSDIKSVPPDAKSLESLIELANRFPPEPKDDLPPLVERKPFNTATGEERKLLRKIPDYERELLNELTLNRNTGLRCEVCGTTVESASLLKKCRDCLSVHCQSCKLPVDDEEVTTYTCQPCRYRRETLKEKTDVERAQCMACFQPGGPMRRAYAKPLKLSYWKDKQQAFEESLFGRPIWIHSACAYWNPKVHVNIATSTVNVSDVVMKNGKDTILPNIACILCGNKGGLKMRCSHPGGCKSSVCGKSRDTYMHVTCAKQAGFEVSENSSETGRVSFHIKCYRHSSNEFNFRAKIEDLLELEIQRTGKKFSRIDQPIPLNHASRMINAALSILQTLGWAWRWAEWWVDYDSSWEPLLEPGQKEKNMTKEELKIVDSSRESRCADARRCRLAAFGASIRNRAYDTVNGFNSQALHNALTAILSTPSLVGPLTEVELDIVREWLDMAYKSGARVAGLGEYKIPVDPESPVCHHILDGSPKSELGERTLPGSVDLQKEEIFETNIDEVDDFLQNQVFEHPRRKFVYKSPGKQSKSPVAVETKPEPVVVEKKTVTTNHRKKTEEKPSSPNLTPSGKRRGRPPGSKNKQHRKTQTSPIQPRSSTPLRARGRPKRLSDSDLNGVASLRSGLSPRTRGPPIHGMEEDPIEKDTTESSSSRLRGKPKRFVEELDERSTRKRNRSETNEDEKSSPQIEKKAKKGRNGKKKRTLTPKLRAFYNRGKKVEVEEDLPPGSPVLLQRNVRQVQEKRRDSPEKKSPAARRVLYHSAS